MSSSGWWQKEPWKQLTIPTGQLLVKSDTKSMCVCVYVWLFPDDNQPSVQTELLPHTQGGRLVCYNGERENLHKIQAYSAWNAAVAVT